jgi:PleD family two-component response regulator
VYTSTVASTTGEGVAIAATSLVERADALLYQAKLSGRNQVCGGDGTVS